MDFIFTVNVSVDRLEGKFASRDEIEQAIYEVLETSDPSQIDCEEGGIYEVTDWAVAPDYDALKLLEQERKAARRERRKKKKKLVVATDIAGVSAEDVNAANGLGG